ncbi:MAG: VWA domain-containing protein [Gammaproteobacteria bacterium]|nr:VWA domain-containing protein [Gammaproteobacteria bacterium]
MSFSEFHFIRPLWLLMLPIFYFLCGWLYQRSNQATLWTHYVDPVLLKHQLISAKSQKRVWPYLGLAGCATVALLALAGPAWEKLPSPVFQSMSARVIILDLSKSMDAGDIQPSRLIRAKHKLIDLLDAAGDTQTALIVFTRVPYVISPLTDDTATIQAMLPSLDTQLPPVQGATISAALKKADELLEHAEGMPASIVLLTDSKPDEASFKVASSLRNQGKRVSVLAVGTTSGKPVPIAGGGFLKDKQGQLVVPGVNQLELQRLAMVGGGVYTFLTASKEDIRRIASAVPNPQLGHKKGTDQLSDQWIDRGPYLLIFILPFLALLFRRGVLA